MSLKKKQRQTLSWYEKLPISFLKYGPVPRHLAFIMDGNRRFAKEKKLKKNEGHQKGLDTLLNCLLWSLHLGVKICTVFAFSIDNFRREQSEVQFLMDLSQNSLRNLASNKNFFNSNQIRVRVCGDLSYCSKEVQESMREVQELTKNNTRLILNICFSYSFTNELDHSLKQIQKKFSYDQIERMTEKDYEEQIFQNLMVNDEPDLLVRTSNEFRLSNFLLMQVQSKTTIIFEKKNWPQLGLLDYFRIIIQYQMKQ